MSTERMRAMVDLVEAATRRNKGPCKVRRLANDAGLGDQLDRVEAAHAADPDSIGYQRLADALNEEGVDVNVKTVSRHLRRGCICD